MITVEDLVVGTYLSLIHILATLMTTVFVVREVRKLRGLREASRVAVRPAVAAGELGDAAAQQA